MPSYYKDDKYKKWIYGGALAALLSPAFFYRTAKANERLIRTGLGLKGIHVSQKCFHIPFFQTLRVVNLEPRIHKVLIEAMSKERISFHMPTVWTLAPKNDNDSVQRYASRLLEMDDRHLDTFFTGIIEGDGRIIAGEMELDEIQGQREKVRQKLMGKLGPDFDALGMEILNVNVAELTDTKRSGIFCRTPQTCVV
jgi:flotillin